eukprot:1332495-Amphidinium_carterae.1
MGISTPICLNDDCFSELAAESGRSPGSLRLGRAFTQEVRIAWLSPFSKLLALPHSASPGSASQLPSP